MFIRSHFLSPDGDPAATPKPRVSAAESFIARYGSPETAVTVLMQDVDAANKTAKAASDLLEETRKQIPSGSKVVLDKTDADELAAYRALNLAPDKLTTALTERDTLKGEVSKAATEKQARALATAAGLDPDAFAEYATRTGLPMEWRDVAVVEHGKTVTKKVAYVRAPGDDKTAFVPASDYVSGLAAHEQRALRASAMTPSTPAGTQWPTGQRPTAASGAPTDPATDYLAKRFAPRPPAGAAAS